MLKAIIFDLGDTLIPNTYIEKFFVNGEIKNEVHNALIPTIETISELKKKYRLGIITNVDKTVTTDDIHNVLQETNLFRFFNVITLSSVVNYDKPDKEIFELTLKKLNVKVDETIMVGDRIPFDILGGNLIGMKTVFIKPNGNPFQNQDEVTNEKEKPTYKIQSLNELIEITNKITSSE